MKARRIKRLRKKIAKKGYYFSRYKNLAEELSRWKRFEKFECSPHFVGRELSLLNTKIYEANAPRLMRKARWYKERFDLTQSELYRRAPIV